MRKYKLKNNNIANDKAVWMGIDAHKKTLHVTIIDSEEVLWKGSIPHGYEHVRGLVNRLENCEITATYESSCIGYRLKHWLEELGCTAFITPVSKVPDLKGGKQIKTDERDSLELAKLLRAGLLRQVHDLGERQYRQRELTRTRQKIREMRTSVGNQIKSKLLFHGIDGPEEIKENWSKDYLAWLKDGPSEDDGLNMIISELVDIYCTLDKKMRRLKKKIEALAKTEEYTEEAELLQTIPGVGPLTAMIFLLELGDISRFDCCEEFSSFLGLVPGEWSSGESQRKTKRVRWGNARARTALVEASWTLVGKDPRMKETYERIKRRRGSGRAIVAVARRLGLICRAILRDGKSYHYPGHARRAESTP